MNEELRVLILEDDEIDAELMERELRKANIAFLSKRVGTGETFQKELKDFSPDIILADYTLPAFDGCSALRIVKQRCPNTPFIFVSGTIGEDFAIESLKNGATDYVIKDRISRLAPAVRRALSEVKERDECMRAEKALRESEMRFRSLVESAHDAIILTDGSGNIISCNKSAQTIFGYTDGEMLGKPIIHFMPERYRSAHQQRMEHFRLKDMPAINGKIVASFGLREDGSEFPLEISIATWRIEGKMFFSAIMRDITERRRAEEELKIKAQLLDDSTDTVFVHDLDGNFIYLNERAYRSRGFDKDEMMGINLHELVVPEYEKLLKPRFRQLIENGEGTFESAHFRRDRSVIPVEAHARIIESGGRKLVLSIIRDITERKRAEELLKEKARAELYGFIVSALPVFAAGVPSQVRNTLVKNFGERFEKNIMPRFEEEMGRYSRDRSIGGAVVDVRQDELDFFISWLTGMFSNLGIRTRTAPKSTGRVFELLNCPWKGEASGNPIFCFICRTIMRRSLTWMPFKGSTEQRSSIANGSQVCGFDIHVK